MKNLPGPNMFQKHTTEIIAINHADFFYQFGSRSLKGKKSNLEEEKKDQHSMYHCYELYTVCKHSPYMGWQNYNVIARCSGKENTNRLQTQLNGFA